MNKNSIQVAIGVFVAMAGYEMFKKYVGKSIGLM